MRVEIWSDVVCPWCYIGKRRFEAALSRFAHAQDVEVVWRAFELDTTAPRSHDTEGDYAERLARKYGQTREQAESMIATMTAAAAADGLDFRFDLARTGNTFDAHRLLHLAADRGRQDAVKERLMRATFTDGEPVGDVQALVRLGAQAGLDVDEARRVLAGNRYAEEVRADERAAAEIGVSGVPFFLIDRRYAVSGAQPADLLLGALERAWSERQPARLPVDAGDAASCDGEGCQT